MKLRTEPMNEDEMKAGIMSAAWSAGWMIHHDRPAQRADGTWTTAIEGHPGFPDLVLVHRHKPAIVVAELKGDGGRLTRTQSQWLDRLDAAGVYTELWTPENYDDALELLTHPDAASVV